MWLDRLIKEKWHQEDSLEDGSMAANQLGRLRVQQQEGALGTRWFFRVILNVPLQVDQRTAGYRFPFPLGLYDSPYPTPHFYLSFREKSFLAQWANLERVLYKPKHAKARSLLPSYFKEIKKSPLSILIPICLFMNLCSQPLIWLSKLKRKHPTWNYRAVEWKI